LAERGVKVRSWNIWAAVVLAVVGAGICLVALIGFVSTVNQNNLAWQTDQSIREHYLAVGHSYSQGFTVGFFLCFFLILIAVSLRSLLIQRSKVQRPEAGPDARRHPLPTR
jgi:hypothetical protein